MGHKKNPNGNRKKKEEEVSHPARTLFPFSLHVVLDAVHLLVELGHDFRQLLGPQL